MLEKTGFQCMYRRMWISSSIKSSSSFSSPSFLPSPSPLHRNRNCSTSAAANSDKDCDMDKDKNKDNIALRRIGMGKPKGYANNAQYVLQKHTLSGLPFQLRQGKQQTQGQEQTFDKQNTDIPDYHRQTLPFTVLGIESSCDDTGVSIVRSDGTILSNIVYSQYAVHEKFGGVVPSLAMAAHSNNIDQAITDALSAAGMTSIDDVDAIAVTTGPGLEICLRVGCRKAQALAIEHAKPFVTVHHLEAHCLIARLAGSQIKAVAGSDMTNIGQSEAQAKAVAETVTATANTCRIDIDTDVATNPHFTPHVQYPFLTLLVSGGHTSLLVCRGLGQYDLIGGTLDDSLGEAFDKAARLLGLPVTGSGGAAVEAAAASSSLARRNTHIRYQANNILSRLAREASAGVVSAPLIGVEKDIIREFRRKNASDSCTMFRMRVPLRDRDKKNNNCDFSFSGLKNSFRMAVARYRDDIDLTLPMTRTGAEAEAGDKTAKYKYNFHNPNAPMQEMQEVNSENIVSIPADVAANLCYAFQDVAFAHLEDRLERALDLLDNTSIATSTATVNARACTALVVVGGVAANLQLRQRLMDLLSIRSARAHTRTKTAAAAAGTGKQSNNVQPPMPLIFPPIHLCTDNGVMVAWTGIEKLLHGISDDPYDQEVVARWPLGSQVHY